MPRNPNKRCCQTPGCNAWAMRSLPGSGNTTPAQAGGTPAQAGGTPANHCRSHMGPILGPHRVGAPKRNLNALKTGRCALSMTGHPLSKGNLELTAHLIAQKPHQIAEILSGHINLIHSRTGDAYLSLLLLARLTQQLLPLEAGHRFHLGLSDFLTSCHGQPATRFTPQG
jgi:hypothetical protein